MLRPILAQHNNKLWVVVVFLLLLVLLVSLRWEKVGENRGGRVVLFCWATDVVFFTEIVAAAEAALRAQV